MYMSLSGQLEWLTSLQGEVHGSQQYRKQPGKEKVKASDVNTATCDHMSNMYEHVDCTQNAISL